MHILIGRSIRIFVVAKLDLTGQGTLGSLTDGLSLVVVLATAKNVVVSLHGITIIFGLIMSLLLTMVSHLFISLVGWLNLLVGLLLMGLLIVLLIIWLIRGRLLGVNTVVSGLIRRFRVLIRVRLLLSVLL